MHTCKNCDNQFEGEYCNKCGQNIHLHKINLKYVWFDVSQGLLSFDTGFLYTVKQLLSRPGHTAREYIEGKRVAHFRPVSFLIVLTTFEVLLFHIIGFRNEVPTYEAGYEYAEKMTLVNDWLENHQTITLLASLPIFAFWTYLFFPRQKYNYAELLILNFFVAGQRIVIGLLIFPVFYFLKIGYGTYTTVSLLISYILIAWIYTQFFNKANRLKTIILALFTNFLSFVSFMILSVFIILGYLYLFGS
ncbi:DUF3667 domain-containing protein [Maribellus mangrovi]|uniref:DUF3667 domain-containing protein n=1 Tax=Maribellus mangrovi TaxID=3133146 RepID=UPI0030EF496E